MFSYHHLYILSGTASLNYQLKIQNLGQPTQILAESFIKGYVSFKYSESIKGIWLKVFPF